ncbi:hypothetical protein AQUCO_03600088v1 [Aquilegia coerulea]|uniref:Uncharacterized protein n=1 Tax=Aquilegia coerulea TaxID=218851 RepID=A0A2G5CV68_AQUCA|nr:hypothetical protein AQUCO_03600088v1 [Aquilegia coerulea]
MMYCLYIIIMKKNVVQVQLLARHNGKREAPDKRLERDVKTINSSITDLLLLVHTEQYSMFIGHELCSSHISYQGAHVLPQDQDVDIGSSNAVASLPSCPSCSRLPACAKV